MKQSTQKRKEGEKKDKIEGLKSWQNAISLCITTLRGFPRTRTLRDYLYQGGDPRIFYTSLNPMPNVHVCVYLTIHITKLQLQTTFPKPLYIPHSACIHQDPGR